MGSNVLLRCLCIKCVCALMIKDSYPRSLFSVKCLRILALCGFGLLAAGCAQDNKHFAAAGNKFPPSVYGPASPRVVAEGEDVPKGGGTYMVGKPYTVAGHTYYPSDKNNYTAVGMASWYGSDFHGRKTANGEVFDLSSVSAAHPTMPLPSYARVTNLRNSRSIIVRVNDRGPYHGNRVMDVSEKVAEALDFKRIGTAKIKVEYIGRASLAGSDDRKLLASLRTDGVPASLDSIPSQPIMMADTAPPQRLAALEPGDLEQAALVQPVGMTPTPSNMPKPPIRPFDVGAVPSTSIALPAKQLEMPAPHAQVESKPVSAVKTAQAVSQTQVSAPYYSGNIPPVSTFGKAGSSNPLQLRSMDDALAGLY